MSVEDKRELTLPTANETLQEAGMKEKMILLVSFFSILIYYDLEPFCFHPFNKKIL